MASPVIEERVLQVVRDKWKGANVREVQITDRLPQFFRGALYVVSIYDAKKEEHENYVYAVGEELRRYDDLRQLGADVGKSSPLAETLQKAFQFVGISGVIAIIITATICYMVVSRPDPKIPELLAHSLTLILGFYFGTTVRSAAK
jgi:hypothetical protein